MSLRDIVEADLATMLENIDCGWNASIVLTDPAGVEKTLAGQSSDISQLIDPDTGTAVSGRLATVSLRISSILSSTPGPALTLPRGIADTTGKPWLVAWTDTQGEAHTFKVAQSNPDRMLGVLILILENYKTA